MTLKTCTGCKRELPATNEHFHWKKKADQKLDARCKRCIYEYQTAYREKNAELVSSKLKAWRKANDADIKKKKKEYRIKNKEAIKERSRVYRIKYADALKERKALHYKNNREYYRRLHKKYYEENYETFAASVRRNSARRKARIKQNGFEFYTENEVLEKYGTTCYLCNEEIDLSAPRLVGKPGWQKGLHIDHYIPIARGGPDNLENVRPTHGFCNLSKNAFDISSVQGYNK